MRLVDLGWRMLAMTLRVSNAVRRRRKASPEIPGNVRRILVIKLDAVGDIIMATPFLRGLHESFPAARITVVTRPATLSLLEHCPHVHELIPFEPALAGTEMPDERNRCRALLFARRLSGSSFDLAVLPRWDHDYYNGYYLLCGSGASRIAAYERVFGRVSGGWVGRREQSGATIVRDNAVEHEVPRNLALVSAVGGRVQSSRLELSLSESDRAAATTWLKQNGLDSGDVIVAFGIGASIPQKCWPEAKFAQFIRILVDRFGAAVVLVGAGSDDRRRAQAILEQTEGLPVRNAVGVFSLRETAALMEQCSLFVGNDSGPMHLAAAVQTPVVMICGMPEGADDNRNFSPARFGPWAVPSVIVRPPASSECANRVEDDADLLQIEAVTTDSVEQAVQRLLEMSPSRVAPRSLNASAVHQSS